MRHSLMAGTLALLALLAVATVAGHDSQAIITEEDVPRHTFADDMVPGEDVVLAQAEEWYGRSRRNSPAEVEANALRAVEHTKKAAVALRTTRQAVIRLQELGDTAGATAALRAEQHAKRAFVAARATSAPLVAEARANYEATQGTQIQGLAKQVAQDTWRTMTGTPLPPAVNPRDEQDGGLRIYSGSGRADIVRRSSADVARDYASEARQAQAAAVGAQRKSDKVALLPPALKTKALEQGNPAVAAIARYAKQAQDAMAATTAAKEVVQQQLKEIKEERTALEKSKNETVAQAALKGSAPGGAADVITTAEHDVSNSMRIVEDAANKRGMVDNSWKARIGDMIKGGQTAAAHEAASHYVQKQIDHAAASKVGDGLGAASDSVDKALATVNAAAKKHGTEFEEELFQLGVASDTVDTALATVNAAAKRHGTVTEFEEELLQ